MLKETDIRVFPSPVTLINDDWGILTAGPVNDCNMMTISWGAIGELWNKHVAFIFVRPGRYTYEFMERNNQFTVSFFDEQYKPALSFCGSHSGRDFDKEKETGLHLVPLGGAAYPEQASRVIVCKKAACQDIDPKGFIDPSISGNYDNDYHRMYIGEILSAWENK